MGIKNPLETLREIKIQSTQVTQSTRSSFDLLVEGNQINEENYALEIRIPNSRDPRYKFPSLKY